MVDTKHYNLAEYFACSNVLLANLSYETEWIDLVLIDAKHSQMLVLMASVKTPDARIHRHLVRIDYSRFGHDGKPSPSAAALRMREYAAALAETVDRDYSKPVYLFDEATVAG